MRKHFHSLRLPIIAAFCFTGSIQVPKITAEENPGFFTSAEGFFASSMEWDQETFNEKWIEYPGYLKYDLLKLSQKNRSSNAFYEGLLKRIATVELIEFDESEPLTEDMFDEIEQHIRSRFVRNEEKLDWVGQKYLQEKDQNNITFEREAQFLHYAFSYFCPIGSTIEPIVNIFGQPSGSSNGVKSYFFGNQMGGYRFDIHFDDSDVVTRVSLSIF